MRLRILECFCFMNGPGAHKLLTDMKTYYWIKKIIFKIKIFSFEVCRWFIIDGSVVIKLDELYQFW